jgi:ATP-dependent DNA helicase RecQ
MYSSGKNFEEISNERNLALGTVKSHIIDCYLDGYSVNLDDFIPKDYEDLIINTIKSIGSTDKLKAIKEALPNHIDYSAIKAVLYKYRDIV